MPSRDRFRDVTSREVTSRKRQRDGYVTDTSRVRHDVPHRDLGVLYRNPGVPDRDPGVPDRDPSVPHRDLE